MTEDTPFLASIHARCFYDLFLPQKEGEIPTRQSSHTPIAGKPMARAIGFPAIQFPQRRMSAAALSAAVDSTKSIGEELHSQAEPSKQKRPNPNASRSSGERGLGGEGLLSEKPPLPPESPHRNLFGREREGGDFSSEKSSPSHMYPLS